MDNNKEKEITEVNEEDIDKNDTNAIEKTNENIKILEKPDKKDVRNLIWIIMLFIILFAVLIMLPYMSNYR